MATDSTYSIIDLRQMDREEARRTLPVAEFERWEKLQELQRQADKTRERFAREDEQVAELSITADTHKLATEVDLYGDTVLVHIDSGDEAFINAAERLEEAMDGDGPEDVPTMDADRRDAIAEALADLFDAAFVEWEGVEWDSLRADQRADHLARLRDAWGLDAMFVALLDIVAAVQEDRSEKVDVIESFRRSQRRGRR